ITPDPGYTTATVSVDGTTLTTVPSSYTFTTITANHSLTATFTPTLPTGDTTAPSVPTTLAATALSASKISLTWHAATDNLAVTGYTIYRNQSRLTTVNTLTFTDTGLNSDTSYSYQVSAYDAAGNSSALSTPLTVKTLTKTTGRFHNGGHVKTITPTPVYAVP